MECRCHPNAYQCDGDRCSTQAATVRRSGWPRDVAPLVCCRGREAQNRIPTTPHKIRVRDRVWTGAQTQFVYSDSQEWTRSHEFLATPGSVLYSTATRQLPWLVRPCSSCAVG